MVLEFLFPVSLIGNILPNDPGTLDCPGVWSGTQQVEVPRLYTMMATCVSSALHLSRVQEIKKWGLFSLNTPPSQVSTSVRTLLLEPLNNIDFRVCCVCVDERV